MIIYYDFLYTCIQVSLNCPILVVLKYMYISNSVNVIKIKHAGDKMIMSVFKCRILSEPTPLNFKLIFRRKIYREMVILRYS